MWKNVSIAMASAFLLLMLVSAQAQISPEEKKDIMSKHYTATLMITTALTGSETAKLAVSNLLDLSGLDDKARTQVINAAQVKFGSTLYDQYFADFHSNTPLGLVIETRFFLTFSGGALGDREYLLRISELMPAISGKVANTYTTASLPPVADPPSFASIQAAVPVSADEKIPWLRSQTLALLGKIADVRLSRASVPFTSVDLTNGKTIDVKSLTPAQSQWLSGLYEKNRLKIAFLAEAAKSYREDPSRNNDAPVNPASVMINANIDGKQVSARLADIPETALPDWPAVQDANVKFSIEYGIGLKVAGTNKHSRVVGWVVD